jgi:RecA/RadA recombinase
MAKKISSLQDVLGKFSSVMGEGVIHTASVIPPCVRIRSSVPAYNFVTDGGFPVGRVIEHYGENGSLKSYMAYDAISKFQHYDWANHTQDAFLKFDYEDSKDMFPKVASYKLRKGYSPKETPEYRYAVLVDLEGTYTQEWGENFGIDNNGLIIIHPETLTSAVDMVQALLAEREISLVVLDSMSAIGTDDEMENSMENQQMAPAARFWNKAFRKFQTAMNRNETREATLLVINSAYSKVGLVFGDPEVVRNGEQLKRTKTLSVKFKPLKEIEGKTDEGDLYVGRNIHIRCMKNKVGVQGRESTFFYSYVDYEEIPAGKTDTFGQLVDIAIRFGVVQRKGAWYMYNDLKVQGMDNFIRTVSEEGVRKSLEKDVYNELFE